MLKKARYYRHVYSLQKRSHERWSRKLPHNRLKWHKVSRGVWKSEVWLEPKLFSYEDIYNFYDEYCKALPVKSKDKVIPLTLSLDQIKAMVEKFENWLVEINRHKR